MLKREQRRRELLELIDWLEYNSIRTTLEGNSDAIIRFDVDFRVATEEELGYILERGNNNVYLRVIELVMQDWPPSLLEFVVSQKRDLSRNDLREIANIIIKDMENVQRNQIVKEDMSHVKVTFTIILNAFENQLMMNDALPRTDTNVDYDRLDFILQKNTVSNSEYALLETIAYIVLRTFRESDLNKVNNNELNLIARVLVFVGYPIFIVEAILQRTGGSVDDVTFYEDPRPYFMRLLQESV